MTPVTRAGVGTSVSSAEITDGTIVNADINASAAVALSKLGVTDELGSATFFPRLIYTYADGVPTDLGGAGNICYVTQLIIPWKSTITGIAYSVGATAAGNAKSALYNAAGSTKLAERTTNSTQASAGAFSLHSVAFDAPYVAAAGTYRALLFLSDATATAYRGLVLNAYDVGAASPPATASAAFTLGGAYPIVWTY